MTADAEDASHNIYPLTVEYVAKVPGYEWLNCVIIRLNDTMGNIGDMLVRLSVRGIPSHRVRLGVGHNGGVRLMILERYQRRVELLDSNLNGRRLDNPGSPMPTDMKS